MQCQLEQFCQTTKGLGWKMCKSPPMPVVVVPQENLNLLPSWFTT